MGARGQRIAPALRVPCVLRVRTGRVGAQAPTGPWTAFALRVRVLPAITGLVGALGPQTASALRVLRARLVITRWVGAPARVILFALHVRIKLLIA